MYINYYFDSFEAGYIIECVCEYISELDKQLNELEPRIYNDKESKIEYDKIYNKQLKLKNITNDFINKIYEFNKQDVELIKETLVHASYNRNSINDLVVILNILFRINNEKYMVH